MCTVTFLPLQNSILLTSNRDEQILRTGALLPECYELSSGPILFPKDGQAGGTWVALHNNGNAMVLLNGAFKKHRHLPPYKRSRGLVFLEIFNSNLPTAIFQTIDLDNIEPFTLVIWQQNNLWEARWDGEQKYLLALPAHEPQIWSSVTLYDPEVIALRKAWFKQWLDGDSPKTAEGIRQFHEFGGDGNESTQLKMNRGGLLQTLSITAIQLYPNKALMYYKDFLGGLVSVNEWFKNGQIKKL